jgi:hypothetical protein
MSASPQPSTCAKTEADSPFKRCSVCRHVWETRELFLNDAGLELIGYQVSFAKLTSGLFLFNHVCKGATLAIPAREFRDLYSGPVFKERATQGPGCPGYCLHRDDLRPCPAQCECAYVREIIQVLRNWPKRSETPLRGERGE